MNIPGIPYYVAQLIKNKYLVRKCLYENSVDDTEKCYEIKSKESIEEIKNELPYPVIVKPCDGSGSRGTSRVHDCKRFRKGLYIPMESSLTHKAEIEPFIFGKEYGAESIVVDGEVHVFHQL